MKTKRNARRGEYEIITNDKRTLLTGSRERAVAEVGRLLAQGVSKLDIYATYDAGRNYLQAAAHLLLPVQN